MRRWPPIKPAIGEGKTGPSPKPPAHVSLNYPQCFPAKENRIRRAERLFRLVQALRWQKLTRAEDLARALEVSSRTIYRDIAHLQGSGLPIEGAAGLGYILRPGFDLPSMTFTHDQIEALALGLAFAERTGDPQIATAAREARAKLQAALPQPELYRLTAAPFFSLHPKAPPTAALLRRAIRQRRQIAFAYCDGAGQSSNRRLRPLAIWSFPNGWMVSGWCETRQDFRSFRFDRISDLILTETRFEPDEATSLQAFLASESCDRAPGA